MKDQEKQAEQSGKVDQCPKQKKLLDRIDNDFTYHRPPVGCGQDFVDMREKAKELATLMTARVPIGRELSSALTRLEEAVMHANAGIARQYPVETEKH